MSFTYENQGTNTYLTYKVEESDELDTMSLGMLTNNHIPGFAAASFMQMDTTKYIKYNVSAKVSAAQLFSGPVNKKRLVGVFSGILDAMIYSEEYMLDPRSILLDMNYIFVDVSTCDTVLVCLPVVNQMQQEQDLGMFFKNIIFRTQFDQTENCDHVAQIINYLNSTPALNLEDFKEVLSRLTSGAKPVPAPVAQQPVQKAAPQPVIQRPAPQPVVQQPVVQQPVQQPVVQQPVVQQPVVQQPVQRPVQQPAYPAGGANAPEEKPISMMYLLQHYNKENAAKYKAQQEAKKAQKASGSQKPEKPAAKQKPSKEKAKPAAKQPAAAPVGFAIPGQQPQMPGGMAIHGQQPAVQQPAQRPVQQPVQPAPKPVQQYVQPQPEPQIQVVQPTSKPISFGETMVLSGAMGETSVLGGGAAPVQVQPHLIRVKTSEKIPLSKPVFRIGKERSYVDYFVADNTAVSRSHANIVNHNGDYFVVDTNSTNHTYVNGGMIQSNVETKLSHDTKIRLANEEFVFKLY